MKLTLFSDGIDYRWQFMPFMWAPPIIYSYSYAMGSIFHAGTYTTAMMYNALQASDSQD